MIDHLSWRAPVLACILACVMPGAFCSAAASISTADTSIRVESASAGVILRSLEPSGGNSSFVPGDDAAQFSTQLISSAIFDGRSVQLHWKQESDNLLPAPARGHVFTFSNDVPPMQAISSWSAVNGPGPVEHTLNIVNRGKKPVLLPLQASLHFAIDCSHRHKPLEAWWVEKGAGRPSQVGVHRLKIEPGFQQSLDSGPYSGDNPHEPIPWTTIYDPESNRGLYLGVESSARVRILMSRASKAEPDMMQIEAGFQPGRDYLTRLAPGESLQLPTVFVGCYTGDVDSGCNRLRKWVAAHLRPPTSDPRYPLLVNNSWGNGMAIDEALCRRMIDSTADLGLEMYHIDAGWFAGVGDWRPNPTKFPRGLLPVVDYAHSKNLRFGLWVGWTQGGASRADLHDGPLSVFDPKMRDWFAHDAAPNWKPQDFTGMTVCLGDPAAADWCLARLRHVIADNKLDMLEHDQQMVLDECGRDDHLHTRSSTDVSYRAAQGYYRIYDTLRHENPNLLFEDCVNGGRMVDYGIIRRVHYISITDVYDPLSNRQAFYDASFALPPAMCECYVENHPGKDVAQFKAMLRSGMMGWCTIMTDTTQWSAQQKAAARRQFALYKSELRPLIQHADLYHVSDRPDGARWDGIEYFDPESQRGVLFAFRGTTPDAEHLFRLKGLDPATTYHITSANGGIAAKDQSGQSLRDGGLKVTLGESQTSDLIFLNRR